jgi:hypothetical protein
MNVMVSALTGRVRTWNAPDLTTGHSGFSRLGGLPAYRADPPFAVIDSEVNVQVTTADEELAMLLPKTNSPRFVRLTTSSNAPAS